MAIEQKKISDVINRLTAIMKEHGDLPCVYSCDSEGNSFSPVYFDATPGRYNASICLFETTKDNINAVCIN